MTAVMVSAEAQIDFKRVASFPAELHEISGMVLKGDTIYALNDGGNAPKLYLTDTQGSIQRIFHVKAENQDWEELTAAGDSLLFIGDFGNNDNTRKQLRILKVDLRKISGDTLYPEEINFHYEDQVSFPPPASQLQFDCEAMVWLRDTLHLFTKNRTSPFDGWIKHYTLPSKPGNYAAQLRDSFKAGGFLKELFWVTGAALSPDNQTLALISSDKVYTFSGFSGSAFFSGNFETIALGDISQKEAIAFENQTTLWISDEANSLQSAGLYRLIKKKPGNAHSPPKDIPEVWYSRHDQSVHFRYVHPIETITIYTPEGRFICQFDVHDKNCVLPFTNRTSGHYLCEITSGLNKQICVFRKF